MDVWREATRNWSELCVAMGCSRTEVAGALVLTYPIQRSGAFYNSALVQNPQSIPIEKIEELYAERNLPFAVILPKLKPYTELGRLLEERGYSPAPAWTLMTHKEWVGRGNPEVRVDEINGDQLGEWFELNDVFPHAESYGPTRLEMIERIAKEKSAQLLLASLQRKYVGAALLFMKYQVASIHLVATLTEFRRRHVATTVTLEAIRRAGKDVAGLLWLRTRKGGTGEKVYTRIGFAPFADIQSYTKTPQYEDCNLPPK